MASIVASPAEKTTRQFTIDQKHKLDDAVEGKRVPWIFFRRSTIRDRKMVLGMHYQQLQKDLDALREDKKKLEADKRTAKGDVAKDVLDSRIGELKEKIKDKEKEADDVVSTLRMYGRLSDSIGFEWVKRIAAERVMRALDIDGGYWKKSKIVWMLENNIPVTGENVGRGKRDLLHRIGSVDKDNAIIRALPEKERVLMVWDPRKGEGVYFSPSGRGVASKDAETTAYWLHPILVVNKNGAMIRYDDGTFEVVRFQHGKRYTERSVEDELRVAEKRLSKSALKVYGQLERGESLHVSV